MEKELLVTLSILLLAGCLGVQSDEAIVTESGPTVTTQSTAVERTAATTAPVAPTSEAGATGETVEGTASGSETATGTWVPTSTPTDLDFVAIESPGADGGLTEEAIVFENEGHRELELSGWTVRDGDGHVYRVPLGTTLAPGERLRIVTGDGTDGDGVLYWGASESVWDETGDEVVVRTRAGETAVDTSY